MTMPPKAYIYAIPYEYYEKDDVRRYGFHGTSHRYVSARAIDMLGNPEHSRVICCHLGNGLLPVRLRGRQVHGHLHGPGAPWPASPWAPAPAMWTPPSWST